MAQELPSAEEQIVLRVSAILVAYNQVAGLRRAIAALEQSQERERLEILVVDCGSQDGSAQIDAEFPSVTMLRLPHHLGAAKAMNIALRTAKADLVLFLSPEAEVEPDTVARLAGKLEPEENVMAVCPLLVNPEGEPVSRIFRLPNRELLTEACRGSDPAPLDLDLTQDELNVEYTGLDAMLARKQFIRGLNYFDQRFGEYWADADLAMQIRRAGKKMRLYPEIRVKLYPPENPLSGDALLKADKILGAAALLGKYKGFFAGLSFRLGAILSALGRFDLRLLGFLVSGQKLDGSQSG